MLCLVTQALNGDGSEDEDEEDVVVMGGDQFTPEEIAAAEARFEEQYGLKLRAPAAGGCCMQWHNWAVMMRWGAVLCCAVLCWAWLAGWLGDGQRSVAVTNDRQGGIEQLMQGIGERPLRP